MVYDFNHFMSSRIEAIADDAFRTCFQALDCEARPACATGFWALATTMFVHRFETRDPLGAPFLPSDSNGLIKYIATEFAMWAGEQGIDSDAESFFEYVGAMRAQLLNHQLGQHQKHDLLRCMAEGVPEFLSLLMADSCSPAFFKAALLAVYTAADEDIASIPRP